MLCDSCKERDAVVHLTQIVDGAVSQVRLCEQCAAARGIETSVQPKNPIGDFLQAVQEQAVQLPGDAVRCNSCGLSLKDFRASGKLGCAHCYGAFEQSLRELLRRVHGGTRHEGWRPEPSDPDVLERDAALAELRAKLSRAVETEAFEEAASLRDRIRGLE